MIRNPGKNAAISSLRPELVGVVVFALAVRIAAAWVWQFEVLAPGEWLRFGDSHSYWTMASNLWHDGVFQYGSSDSKIFRAPLYPMLLAPWTGWDHQAPTRWGVMGARLMGCVLGAWAVWLVMRMALVLGGPRCAFWAGVFAAIYPGAVAMSIFVLSEAIATPMVLVSLACTLVGLEHLGRRDAGAAKQSASQESRESLANQPSTKFGRLGSEWGFWGSAMLAGAALGLACLARPSWSLWPAFAFPYLAWYLRTNRCQAPNARGGDRCQAPHGNASIPQNNRCQALGVDWIGGGSWMALYCAGLVCIMSPWWVRNYAITGKFVPTTLQVGASLYDGWHPGASGASDENMDFVLPFLIEQKRVDALLAEQGLPAESTYEWRVDRRMRDAALAWAWENPSDVIRLGLLKLARMWSPLPQAKEVGQPWMRWSEAIGYVGLIALAGIGAWSRRTLRGAWWTLLPCLYLALLHAIFIGSVRYRQPGVLMLCPCAALGCVAIFEWIQSRFHGTNSGDIERH